MPSQNGIAALSPPFFLKCQWAEQATLMVNDLKQPSTNGGIARWVGRGTIAYFTDLKITR